MIRACLEPRCPEPALVGGRCRLHRRAYSGRTHRNRDVYDRKRWRRLRRAVLLAQPLCRCGELATEADHIVPIDQGGAKWARANLQGLCKACHSRKTMAEREDGADSPKGGRVGPR